MTTKKLTLLLCLLVIGSNASLIDDILSRTKDLFPISDLTITDEKSSKLPEILYELPPEHEAFLKEGLKLLDAPTEALDACTHRVVMTLRKNCNQLTLEETGKLAVMLLNCQLQIEDRPTFTCKPEMTLKQCTVGMDAQMYQIYSYMNHRASAVCFAVKQQQFKAVAEMTVDRLMQASQSQIDTIKEFQKNLQRLNEMQQTNFKDFQESDVQMKKAQAQNLENLKSTENLIDENLKSLQMEFELLKTSEQKFQEVDETTNQIVSRLMAVNNELSLSHDKLLKQTEEISANLRQNNLEIKNEFQTTMEFVESFRTTLQMMSKLSETIKSYTDTFSHVMTDMGIEVSMEFIPAVVVNIVYGALGMIFLMFIGAANKTKTIFVGTIVFNCAASYGNTETNALMASNILVWISYSVYKFGPPVKRAIVKSSSKAFSYSIEKVKSIKMKLTAKPKRKSKSRAAPVVESESEEDDEDLRRSESRDRSVTPVFRPTKEKKCENSEISRIFESRASSVRPATPVFPARAATPAFQRIRQQESMSENSRPATPYLSGGDRIQCAATTARNLQCKNAAVPGYPHCRVHNLRQ